MKLKYLLLAFVAGFTAAACSEDQMTTLDNLKVSSSYVTIPQAGGKTVISIDATEDWTFDFNVPVAKDSMDLKKGIVKYKLDSLQLDVKDCKWLSVSPRSGHAGHTEVEFVAAEATSTRSLDIKIKAGDKFQNLIVSQVCGKTELEISTCKAFNEGIEGVTYRVKGAVTKITETAKYGNFYISDGTGEVYIYGTKYNGQTEQAALEKLGIAVGDEVTIEGPRKLYGTTVECVDVDVIAVKKALLASKNVNNTITKAAQDLTIAIEQKGEGLKFNSNDSWLVLDNGYAVNKGVLNFKVSAQENTTGATRTGTLTFVSTKGDDESTVTINVKQLGSDATADGNLKKIVTAISASSSSKSPVSFDMEVKDVKVTYKTGSNFYLEDETSGLLLYDGSSTLKVGDVITGRIYGSGYLYNNLPEITSCAVELAKVTKGDAPDPKEVTMAELAADFNGYVSRYVTIKNVAVATAIDVNYTKVVSKGSLSEGSFSVEFNHNKAGSYLNPEQEGMYTVDSKTGAYKSINTYYYLNVPAGDAVDVVTIPTLYKTNKQLGVYKDWITPLKK